MDQIPPSESTPPETKSLPPQTGAPVPQPLSTSEEHTWAMLAHLSILLNLITGFLGVLAALVIYLAFKDRSKYVAYQSMQSFVFQLIFWFGAGLLAGVVWTVTLVSSVILIGLICIPLACLISIIPFAALIYGVGGAVQANTGEDFKYWLVGDWVRGELTRS
jgi:uncharacterized Tic20 family protein